MKKEVIIAIILGFFLGGLLSFIIVKSISKNQIIKNKPNLENENTYLTTKKKVEFKPLEILSPEENLIVYQNQIEIKLKLNKDTLLIIQSPIKELSVFCKEESFSTNFPLALGENLIEITAYSKERTIPAQRKIIKVYYLNDRL